MKNGMVIIDADGHAVDAEPIYRERLPERYRKRNFIHPSDGFDRNQNGMINKRPETPAQNLADNDREGIDLQIIYPTGGLFLSRVREPDYAVALCRTYNDWLYDWCAADRKRLTGVALVPLHVDVKAAITEMERAVSRLGMVGVMVNTFDRSRNVAHRDFWPFYEECARQGVAVAFHASGSDTMDPLCHFDNFLQVHTLSHAPEQLIACTAVIYSGLLEKYQDLRVAFLEAGIGWVPFWMEHMDEEYEYRAFDAPLLKAKPSEYMTCGRVFVSCEPEEKTLRYVPDFFPEDNILFASDYPHWDGQFPNAVATLSDRTDIADDLKRKIFFDNPQRFYGLKIDPAGFGGPIEGGSTMPKIPAERLSEIGRALFVAAGTPPAEAGIVMRHVVAANLAGHDSHGVIQIPTYIERIKLGHIVPGAPWKIVQESPTTTVVDGHWGFGYVVNERAMRLTIEKAKSANVAAATVFRQGHIGRVASYTLMAAREGMIGIATADSGRSPKAVAPFGGREARLGTNPISIAMPSDLKGPLYLDMATSAAAAGKIALSVARGTPVPPGWIIDRDGKPTTDPSQLRQGGALLPVGGSEGYKGYGLSVMVEILCGLLTGLGFGVEPTGRHNDGCFMAVFKVDAFRPLAQFKKEIGEFAAYLKATKPAEGSGGVYYPGELEHMREEDRRENGVEVEDATWYKLRTLAEGYGLADQLGFTDVE